MADMSRDQLIASIEALLELDEKGALVPHGIGGLARELLSQSARHIAEAEKGLTATKRKLEGAKAALVHLRAAGTFNEGIEAAIGKADDFKRYKVDEARVKRKRFTARDINEWLGAACNAIVSDIRSLRHPEGGK